MGPVTEPDPPPAPAGEPRDTPPDATPARPSRAARKRQRRFVLPDRGEDRTHEAIEEFIAGPSTRNGRRSRASATPAATAPLPPIPLDPWQSLDARLDWNAALRREEARVARYDRPASVAVVELEARGHVAARPGALARLARPVAFALVRESRESDRIARVSEGRFHVLLPETGEDEAGHYLDRVRAACDVWFEALGGGVVLRVGVAGTTTADGLAGALARAEAALGNGTAAELAKRADPA